MIKLRNLRRCTFRVLTDCCFLPATTFTAQRSAADLTTFAGPAGGPGSVDGTGSAARFTFSRGVATDSAGNVYVADSDRHTIAESHPGGVVMTLAGSTGQSGSAARFHFPRGLAIDSGGNVYVADH